MMPRGRAMPGFKGHGPRSQRRRHQPVKSLLALLLGTLCVSVWYANLVELPQPLVARLMRSADQSSFHISVGRARLLGVHGLRCSDVRLYRRGVVGEAGVTIRHATIFLSRPPQAGLSPFVVRLAEVAVAPSRCRRPPQQAAVVATRKGPIRRHRLELCNLQIGGVTVDSLTSVLQVGGGLIVLDELAATLSRDGMRGALSGVCRIDLVEGRVAGDLSTSANPHVVLPWTDGLGWRPLSTLLRRFELSEATPLIKASFVYRRQERAFDLTGRVLLRDFSYRGVSASRGECDLGVVISPNQFKVSVEELHIVRPEGNISADLAYLARERRFELDVDSRIDLQALARVANVVTNIVGPQITFGGDAHCVAKGALVLKGGAGTRIDAHIEAEHAVIRGIKMEKNELDVSYDGTVAIVTNAVAECCGGRVEVGIVSTQPFGDPVRRTRLDVRVDGARLAQVAAMRGQPLEDAPEGDLDVAFVVDTSSRKDQPVERSGHGKISIRDGRIFSLPIFGGLTELLVKYVPGVDFLLRQQEMDVDFVVTGDRVHSEGISLGGDIFTFAASGDLYLDGRLHYDGQIKLFKGHTLVGKVAHFFVLPISKLFEFELRGTVSAPSWRLSNFSREEKKPAPPEQTADEPPLPATN